MSKQLWKSNIVIWSDFDPQGVGLTGLAREADEGTAYCASIEHTLVEDPASDPDWDGTKFFDTDEGEPSSPEEGVMGRFTAHFTAEAWINDNAIDVDPQGDTEWDCSKAFDELDDDYRRKLCNKIAVHGEALDHEERLQSAGTAPEWVRNWSGTFSLYVRAGPVTTRLISRSLTAR